MDTITNNIEQLKISVIIPVYNAEKTLKKCIDSVLSQTYTCFEIILVDDGSSDSSRKLCDNYHKTYQNILTVHQENKGVSVARNVGIEIAKGDYVFFLDSDDSIKKDLFEKYIFSIVNEKVDVVIGGLLQIDEKGNIKGTIRNKEIGNFGKEIWLQICTAFEIFGYAGGKMISRELISNNDLKFNENLVSQEDLSFCLSVYEVAEKVCLLDYNGYIYNYLPSNRVPQYRVYLKNQMRIVKDSKMFIQYNKKADMVIRERIESLISGFLRSSYQNEDSYNRAIESIVSIDGLMEYLEEKRNYTESGFIAQEVRKNHFRLIRYYYFTRDKLRKLSKGIR